jgi:hypothetical protein
MLLWDITEFVVIITRRSISKGIPPGAHVGVELVLWLGTIATVIAESLKLNWGRLTLSVEDQILEELDNWVRVTLTQFSFLSLLMYVFT